VRIRTRGGICRKGTRKAPLSAAQQRRNHRIAKDRVFVEHAFARLAHQGGKSLRTIGLARARVVIGLKQTGYFSQDPAERSSPAGVNTAIKRFSTQFQLI